MSLTKCPYCNNNCSTLAEKCPWCDNNLKSNTGIRKMSGNVNWINLLKRYRFILFIIVLLPIAYMAACEIEKPTCVRMNIYCLESENIEKENAWRKKYLWWQQ